MKRIYYITAENLEKAAKKRGTGGLSIDCTEAAVFSAPSYNELLKTKTDGFLYVRNDSDRYEKGSFEKNLKALILGAVRNAAAAAASDKIFSNGGKPKPDSRLRQQNEGFLPFPDKLTGVVVDIKRHKEICKSAGKEILLNESLTYDMEADFLLRLLPYHFYIDHDIRLLTDEPSDIDFRFIDCIYDKEWYFQNITGFLLPYFEEHGGTACGAADVAEYDGEKARNVSDAEANQTGAGGKTCDPADGHEMTNVCETTEDEYLRMCRETAEYYALYCIRARLEANKDNRNRHVLDEKEIAEYKELIRKVLQNVSNEAILGRVRHTMHAGSLEFCRMLKEFKGGFEPEFLDTLEYRNKLVEAAKRNPGLTAGDKAARKNLGMIAGGKAASKKGRIRRTADNIEEELDEVTEESLDKDKVIRVLHLMSGDIDCYDSGKMRINYVFLDRGVFEGQDCLQIDATIPNAFDRERVRYFFKLESKDYSKEYPVEWNERYTLTKYFGESAYKRYSFHACIPLADLKKGSISFVMEYAGREYVIKPEYKSHTSRLTRYPKASYWHTGRYLFRAGKDRISFSRYNFFKTAALELAVWWQLFISFKKHKWNFLLLRMGYTFTRPFYKRKHIWMFFDKIYKGGDSAEYLYKFAEAEKKGRKITNYYLLDEKVPDYRRLKAEGYEPLRRKSIRHRLAFLNAEMMIVSNSTVFAFNDYYLENSRYVRGITDFHVVCVQHGLSVQKIAVAQNRLRDNTRLYFCASKYEIENLMRPVYDYAGYDALKLTGVPRYDGLKDDDKKQILISPTWRMQSAKLVSKNEGVERDYNDEFKQSDYFRVYNSLINDKRLIEAAEKYGYSIKYVLHPIVSPQLKDFDTNPYVEIIPSTGEMSYEKLFCESSLMVTDYSGVQFDFAYMRKPLVYLHHNDLEAHYEEGSFIYDTMAFGEIVHTNEELIETLTEYMKQGCRMKEEYRKRADDFFAFDDRNNCRRIYDELLAYYDRNFS